MAQSDILIELSREEIIKLSEKYKDRQADAPHIYSHLLTVLSWQEKTPNKKIMTVYAPEGDFADGTFITLGNFPIKTVILYSWDEQLSRLENALMFTNMLDDERILYFCVEERFVSLIDRVMNAKDIRLSRNDATFLWKLENSRALNLNVNYPPGFAVKPLEKQDVELINDKLEPSLSYVDTLIELNGGYGIYTENDNLLVAWILKTPIGQLGILQVLDEYRGLGLASALICKLSKDIASNGCHVVGTVATDNEGSQNLFKKNGYWPERSGPEIIATKGAIWPKPKEMYTEPETLSLTLDFRFKLIGHRCSILDKGLERYLHIIFNDYQFISTYFEGEEVLMFLDIELRTRCDDDERISDNSDESYDLNLGFNDESVLRANSIWGILRGLETFSQLIYKKNSKLVLNYTSIKDEPRFCHRGIMLDTSRHFISVDNILKILDGMSYNKFNVFHWHIVDDQSFPYAGRTYPELSAEGAYDPTLVYNIKDIEKILEHARLRGIRIIVEIDTPSHTRSWGASHPEFLTKCLIDGEWTGQYGPFDPSVKSLYGFLKSFFDEILEIFPDSYLHIGGDEIDYSCWKNHMHIDEFIKEHRLGNFTGLEQFYFSKLFNLMEYEMKLIAWQDIFFTNGRYFKDVIFQTWIDDGYKAAERITKAGNKVIFSAKNWYLSQVHNGGDWEKIYKTDPHYIRGNDKQKDLILGGEACMWTENVDDSNVLTRMWPRACATAEKLWSPMNADKHRRAARRLEEHTCRLIKRGIPAQPPNGPGYCV